MTFLDEQLDEIYITENFEKSFPMIKARSKAIVNAIQSGNLFKARSLLNNLPDVSLEELSIASIKKNARGYNEAKRNIKGDTTELQKIYILVYTSLKSLQASTKDAATAQKIEDALSELNDFTKKYWGAFMAKGFTLAILMGFIGWFFGSMPGIIMFFISFGGLMGAVLFWFGVLFLVLRLILNTYFSLKGIK